MSLERCSHGDGQQPTGSSSKFDRQAAPPSPSLKSVKRRRLDNTARPVAASVKQLWFDRLSALYSHLQHSSSPPTSSASSSASSSDGGVCVCRGVSSEQLTVADYVECIECALRCSAGDGGGGGDVETGDSVDSVHLLALTCCHLVMTASLQQRNCIGRCCGRLQQLAIDLPHARLLQLLSSECMLTAQLAAQCLVGSCRMMEPHRSCGHWLLSRLVDLAATSPLPHAVESALCVLRRLVELPVCHADCDEEDEDEEDFGEEAAGAGDELGVCSVTGPATRGRRSAILSVPLLRCHLAAELSSCWLRLTQRFCPALADQDRCSEVLAFLALWTALLSVNNGLSVTSIGPFYGRLECLVGGLTGPRGSPSVPVWRAVIGLYSEVLCYGSTLALQPSVDEHTAACAHTVLRLVRSCRLLDSIPQASCSPGAAEDGAGVCGDQADGDQLVQSVVLLVLKALAVTVKETRGDSSSSSSCSSSSSSSSAVRGGVGSSRCGGGSQEVEEWRVIGRSLLSVVRRLDSWLKQRLPHHHPQSAPCQWLVPVLAARDDWLVEALLCVLDVGSVMQQQASPGASADGECARLAASLCPHAAFLCLLETIHYQHDLLLDFLLSSETCFLLYLLRHLKLVRRAWSRFVGVCGTRLSRVMSVLGRLRLTLRRLVARQLFPYNVAPLVKLLDRCQLLYEGDSNTGGHHHHNSEEHEQYTRLSPEHIVLPT